MSAHDLPEGIRRATVEDAADISRLHTHVHALHCAAHPDLFKFPSAEAFPSTAVEEKMADLNYIFFIAQDGEETAGYAFVEIRERPETPLMYAQKQIHVRELSVDPAYQQRGHGARLVLAAKTLMQAFGVPTLTLSTWAFNREAQAFFERMGFASMYHSLWIRD